MGIERGLCHKGRSVYKQSSEENICTGENAGGQIKEVQIGSICSTFLDVRTLGKVMNHRLGCKMSFK
jgi:hypothetical protein